MPRLTPKIALLGLLHARGGAASYPEYQTKIYNQTLDHFDFSSAKRWCVFAGRPDLGHTAAPAPPPVARAGLDCAGGCRRPHRYLYRDAEWDGRAKLANGCPGPILLYTGNEGPITAFWVRGRVSTYRGIAHGVSPRRRAPRLQKKRPPPSPGRSRTASWWSTWRRSGGACWSSPRSATTASLGDYPIVIPVRGAKNK